MRYLVILSTLVIVCIRGATSQSCNICGDGKTIGNPRVFILIADRANIIRNVTCSRAQFLVNNADNFPRTTEYCDYVVEIATKSCDCTELTETTSAPTTAVVATVAPTQQIGSTSAPTVEQVQSPTVQPSSNPAPSLFCDGKCQTFDSMTAINETIKSINGTGRICVCPNTYSTDAGNCPEETNEPALVIADGQDVTIECVSSNPTTDKCIFGCPAVLFLVTDGGRFTLDGSQATQLTGGTLFSRMVIGEGAEAVVQDTSCTSTTVAAELLRRRKLNQESADGNGGCIKNYGDLLTYNSSFDNCTALFNGGAIWTNVGSSTYIFDTMFSNNAAKDGGAIYSDGQLYLQNTLFESNNATDGEADVAGNGTRSGCGNSVTSLNFCSNSSTPTLGPFNVSSLMPSLVSSNVSTLMPSSKPTSVNSVLPASTLTSCNGKCQTFPTLTELNSTIAGVADTGYICICPRQYRDDCPPEADQPSLVINGNQNITMECVTATIDETCEFACPQIVILVESGGHLSIIGNSAFVFTEGEVYSRMVVEKEAYAKLSEVFFRNTAATLSNQNGVSENIDGLGGGIKSYGFVDISSSTFQECSALFNGGAIWTASESNTTIYNSTFKNNEAFGEGGAIFSDGNLFLTKNTFTGNVAVAGNANVGGNGTADGCENNGSLVPSLSCDASKPQTSTAAIRSTFVALLIPVALLLHDHWIGFFIVL